MKNGCVIPVSNEGAYLAVVVVGMFLSQVHDELSDFHNVGLAAGAIHFVGGDIAAGAGVLDDGVHRDGLVLDARTVFEHSLRKVEIHLATVDYGEGKQAVDHAFQFSDAVCHVG